MISVIKKKTHYRGSRRCTEKKHSVVFCGKKETHHRGHGGAQRKILHGSLCSVVKNSTAERKLVNNHNLPQISNYKLVTALFRRPTPGLAGFRPFQNSSPPLITSSCVIRCVSSVFPFKPDWMYLFSGDAFFAVISKVLPLPKSMNFAEHRA